MSFLGVKDSKGDKILILVLEFCCFEKVDDFPNIHHRNIYAI